MEIEVNFNKEQLEIIDSLIGILGEDIGKVLETTFVMFLIHEGIAKELIMKKLK